MAESKLMLWWWGPAVGTWTTLQGSEKHGLMKGEEENRKVMDVGHPPCAAAGPALSDTSSQHPCDVSIIGPILQAKKLRFREAEGLAN